MTKSTEIGQVRGLGSAHQGGHHWLLMQATSEALLKGLAVAEDMRGDDPEERKEATPTQQRIEAKLDLVLSLLGRLARRHEGAPPPTAMRWSHRGMRLDAASPTACERPPDSEGANVPSSNVIPNRGSISTSPSQPVKICTARRCTCWLEASPRPASASSFSAAASRMSWT